MTNNNQSALNDGSLDVHVLDIILKNLVTEPDSINIQRKIDEQGVLLSVIVDSKDMGIIIGRNGSMASSIKTIMRAVGKANKMNVRVQFLEPDGTVRFTGNGNGERASEDEVINPKITSEFKSDIPSLDEDLKDFVIN